MMGLEPGLMPFPAGLRALVMLLGLNQCTIMTPTRLSCCCTPLSLQ